MCDAKQNDCNNQIRIIRENSQREIDSLKLKLEECLAIIDKDRREKMAIQTGLKQAYFQNIVQLNYDACNILGLEGEQAQNNEYANNIVINNNNLNAHANSVNRNLNTSMNFNNSARFQSVNNMSYQEEFDNRTSLLSHEARERLSPNRI